MRQHALLIGCCGLGCIGFRTDGYGEQLARACDICGSVAAGEQSIVPDAMEALGQDVDQEAADELICCQRHGCVSIRPLDTIVLVPEGDAVRIGGDEPAIGDCDAVGVAGEITQDLPGSANGSLTSTTQSMLRSGFR